MRTIPIALAGEYEKARTTFAELIKFTRDDGEVIGFSSHDRDIVYLGVRYRSALAVNLSDLEKTDDLSVGNSEVTGMLRDAGVTAEDVKAGRWDRAYWVRMQVNWADLDAGHVVIDAGYTGKISFGNNRFTAELLDMLQQVQQAGIVDVVASRCRANLGDEWCTVDLDPYTFTGSIDGVDDPNWSVTDSTRTEIADYFTRGKFTFTTGANAGISREIKNYPGLGVFIFQLPWPFTTVEGDQYEAVAGCDGLLETCKNKFGNVINRQAEDHVAGDDKAIQVGRAQ